MKNGDKVRSKIDVSVGKLVVVSDVTGYVQSLDDDDNSWRTPVCTLKDISKYWKVVANESNNIDI